MYKSLTHDAFSSSLNSKFTVSVEPDRKLELELIEVSELKTSPSQEQFAIVFRGPNEIFLGQGMCTFEHEQMGQFDLFLVPINQDRDGYYYEAIFNRVRDQSESAAN